MRFLPRVPLPVRRFALAVILIVAALITLGPLPLSLLDVTHRSARQLASLLPGIPPDWPRRRQVEAGLNVAVPALTVVLASWAFPKVRPWRIGVAAVTISCSIEMAQLILPGRHAQTRDVMLNAAGASCGAILATLAGRLRQHRHETRSRA